MAPSCEFLHPCRRTPLGDSIAVNGCCLTATAVGDGQFETEAMNQKLDVTALDAVEQGSRVNLELAMRANDRLGGHIVQGHVDGVGTARPSRTMGSRRRVRVKPPHPASFVRGG